ncbi:MAG: polymerase, sigma-24 subunit, subfamily [Myxococcaceae bacterium]|nr:polymerase, sigma-24 subunit, subfamily [Myxococcaceae bacterium]
MSLAPEQLDVAPITLRSPVSEPPPDPSLGPDVLGILSDLARSGRADLVRTARREGASPEDAVEAVQDALCTFLQLAQKKEAPADPSHWPGYLAGIVRNAARNKRRRHHVARPHEDLDALPVPSDAASAEKLVVEAEEHVRLRACVDQLCETQKAVVMLRLLEERPGEDVAESLGISRGYVDVLLHRAKASLRVCMTHE